MSYLRGLLGNSTRKNVEQMALGLREKVRTVSYTHLRAHETVLDLVCRLLLEKKKEIKKKKKQQQHNTHTKRTIL